jgi:hypothetical protein
VGVGYVTGCKMVCRTRANVDIVHHLRCSD